MAKPTAPLLSFGASGTIAKSAVYSTWRGRAYVRRHVVPANPRTSAQTATRDVFAWLQQTWKEAPALWQDPWTLYAKGQPLTNRNAFSRFNVGTLRSQTTLANLVFSPGAKGGLPPTAISVTAGAAQLTVTVTAPVAPTGWTISQAIAVAIPDQNPASGTEFLSIAGSDNSAPYSISLTGLTTATLYRVGAFLEFQKPDLSTAYGTALTSTGTPT